MWKALLFVLTFSGLCVLCINTLKYYQYVRQNKTWAEAQHYCRRIYIDLATIDNQEDHDRLMSVVQTGEKAWIGLYEDLKKWKWALGNAEFNNDTDFNNWKSGEPNNLRPTENCGMITKSGEWRGSYCSTKRPAVCFSEPDPTMYILVNEDMSWNDAKNFCRTNYTDLASMRNLSENNNVSSLVTNLTWIGLSRRPFNRWSDTKRRKWFTMWDKNQPDNDANTVKICVSVNTTTGMWSDGSCEERHPFICHRNQYFQHKTTVKLRFQSSADLNDPDIQQQILEQLHAKLERQGLADFKLRWIETDGQTFHKEPQKKNEGGSGG